VNQSASDTQAAYASSTAHLRHELQRIDLLLQRAVTRVRASVAAEAADLRGLYVTDADVDTLLANQQLIGPGFVAADEAAPRDAELSALAAEIAERVAASQAEGVILRLPLLAERFELSAFEIETILICLAPEIDLKYERLFGYLHDDVTKRRPSVDLALNLLSRSIEDKIAARRYFAATAALRRHRLLDLVQDPAQPQPTLLGTYLKLDEQIVSFLLGSDALDPRLASYAQFAAADTQLGDLLLSDEIKQRLSWLLTSAGDTTSALCYLQGAPGSGKQTAAAAICQRHGRTLLAVDGARVLEASNGEQIMRLIVREARLQGALISWDQFDALLSEERRSWRELLLETLRDQPGLTFLAGEAPWELNNARPQQRFIRVAFTPYAASERRYLWTRALDGAICADDVDLTALANTFRLNARQIHDAAATARNLAHWRDPEQSQISSADLHAACRLQSNRKLTTLARQIAPHHSWDDLVLPADRLAHLREIWLHLKYRAQVYDVWGFERKLALGKGLNILFAGPSGTGKTMAASIIAGELGLDLYKIDLSTILSKYIGETEKNLGRIFAEAETSNAILFFDEADALFGKRSEVKDAHDRYANVEISYLLQRMEEYDGVVILATNLRKNMDDAFVRRMHFTVEFPLPAEPQRRQIWTNIWPDDLPRAADLDLDLLAQRFEVAGGNIRNIALAAAFLAAADGGAVRMAHVLHATRREYQKMGKMVLEREFGDYAGNSEAR
jgi:SpoVK/Ycf46/Vps4 family AAA+-type ATPase